MINFLLTVYIYFSIKQRESNYRSQLEAKSKELLVCEDRISTLESALKLHTQDLLSENGNILKTGSEFLAEIARLRGKDKAANTLTSALRSEVETLAAQVREINIFLNQITYTVAVNILVRTI